MADICPEYIDLEKVFLKISYKIWKEYFSAFLISEWILSFTICNVKL